MPAPPEFYRDIALGPDFLERRCLAGCLSLGANNELPVAELCCPQHSQTKCSGGDAYWQRHHKVVLMSQVRRVRAAIAHGGGPDL